MTDTELSDLTQALLQAANRAGADAADALAAAGSSVSIDVLGGELEHAERAEGVDIGLRVLIGRKQACVSSSDTTPETIITMAERAVAMAREAPDDPHIGLADPSELAISRDAAGLDLVDPDPEPAPATLQDIACRAEAAALAAKGITRMDGTSAAYGSHRMHLAASNGFSGGYARSSHSVSVSAITGEGTGMERDHAGEFRIHGADMPAPETIGRLAADRTLARRGARKPPTGAYPVIYDERVASGLIAHFLAAANGAQVARGVSWLRDLMGAEVLPASLDLIEDPHRPRVHASRPFDAEGLATQRRAIVEKGVLRGWTLDLASARKLGLTSTASAQRSTGSPPSPGLSNIALTQGAENLDSLCAQMGTGLLVTSMMGASINPTTGDYSRGASGFWVDGGEITYPVNECTIAGRLPEMLRTMIPANDARSHLSRVVPSLLVEGLTIAGE